MAHIKRRKRGNGWRYTVAYRDATGRERSAGTYGKRTDADRRAREVERQLERGHSTDFQAAKTTTVREHAEGWFVGLVGIGAKTRNDYRGLLDYRVLPTFGDLPLAAVSRKRVQQWVASMDTEGLSASRIRGAVGLLKRILADAVLDGILAVNAAEKIDVPKIRRSERRFLSAAEVDRLAGEHPTPALVYVMAYGGLRWGEATALRRKRVDVLRGRVAVAEVFSDVNGTLVLKDRAKNDEPIEYVSVPRFVAEALGRHLEGVPDDPEALVFVAPQGGPLRHSNHLRNVWRPATVRGGLDGVTPHNLRHTAGSLLIDLGVDMKRVQAHMRHKSITMTMDVYGHLFPDALDDAMERLDAGFSDRAADRMRTGSAAEVVPLRGVDTETGS